MTSSARKARLAGLLVGAALAVTITPGAAAVPAEEMYVNPSTGYPSSLPTPDEEIEINPSTGFASPQDGATGDHTPAETQPALAEPQSPSGLDWPSAAVGAAAGSAVLLMLLAAMSGVGSRGHGSPLRRRAART